MTIAAACLLVALAALCLVLRSTQQFRRHLAQADAARAAEAPCLALSHVRLVPQDQVLNVHSVEEMARFFRTVADDEWANAAMRSKARQLLKIATQALGAGQVGGGVADD
jgi:hypothetical protein